MEFKGMGLKVVRVCNADVDKHFYGVCTLIDETVKQRLGPL